MSKFYDMQINPVPPVLLTPSRTALLVVDMQLHISHPDGALNRAMEKLRPGSMTYFNSRIEVTTMPAIQVLLDAARRRGIRVVYLTLGSNYPDYRDMGLGLRQWISGLEDRAEMSGLLWIGNSDYRIRDELKPKLLEYGDLIVGHDTFGAFSGDLSATLTELRYSNLIFAGVTTSGSLGQTVRGAAELGFGCVIVDDATADFEECAHRTSLRTAGFYCGRVVDTVETLVYALDAGIIV